MDGFTPNNQPILESKKVWYKTTGGVIFLIIISLFILGVISFMALFGYYAWQLKYGDLDERNKISQQFEPQFSVDSSLASVALDVSFISDYEKYIRVHNQVFGNKDADINIIAFIDFECPYCQATYPVFRQVMEKYEPVVQVVFKNLPLFNIHPNSMVASQAAMCAAEQGKFWEYYNQLFIYKIFDDTSLITYATNLGLNIEVFTNCLVSESQDWKITEDLRDAVELGLRGTPTYIVNGIKIEGTGSVEEWDNLIIQLLNQ